MSGSIVNGSLAAENKSMKSMILVTALVVRLIYLENAESENPKKPGPQFPSFFSTLSFGKQKIVRLSSENEPTALPWSHRGGRLALDSL